MKEITIPVAGITRAVMLRKYGREPIRLSTNDLRRREMMHVGVSNKHLERKQYSLDRSITLFVNEKEYKHMAGRTGEVGFYFYAQDKHRLFQFVWGRVTAGLPALDAIKDYYALMGLTDDDHDMETAVRQWNRFYEEKKKERLTKGEQSVLCLSTVILSERQAELLVKRINRFIDEECLFIDPRYQPAITAWVYCDLTHMTVRQVGEKMGLHFQSVGRSVTRLRQYMEYNADLRTLVAYCLKTTQAKPTPSAAS